MTVPDMFDVIVIGSGHAGCEAILAAARMGCQVGVVTLQPERSGWMPCNPAVGGVGKGQLVREIDALGGEMGLNADATAIQFRKLNTRKGPAVQSRRCQSDMFAYAARMSKVLMSTKNVHLIQAKAAGFHRIDEQIAGVTLEDGSVVPSKTVIVTTGTFLRGLLHTGEDATPGGRVSEPPSNSLSQAISDLQLPMIRLKTGTPPRIDTNTIDYSNLEVQPGDDPPQGFSFLTKNLDKIEQLPCHLTYTNERTHEIIRENIHRSPMYSGKIEGLGPRYCPSIEDKIVRFEDRNRHQVFLEPVARDSNLVYPNGISTSLPADVQLELVHSIEGLQQAKIVHMGYAVEYDAVDPRSLEPTLEVKDIPNLFFAGQINGTSGYEEAGGQGIIAGINAALRVQGKEAFILDRSQAYIGVMIDDLTTRGAPEPYRMFTSRAEYRLLLREDNADQRLTELGRELGLVKQERWTRYTMKMEAIETFCRALKNTKVRGGDKGREDSDRLGIQPLKHSDKLFNLLKRNGITVEKIRGYHEFFRVFEPEVVEQVLIEERYSGYLANQEKEAALFREGERIKIPEGFVYDHISCLSTEVKELLKKTNPRSIGHASRVPGITPASLKALTFAVEVFRKENRTTKTAS